MQTFLPYQNFRTSLETLDNKRLGKQRVETAQLIKAIEDPSYGWQNHPATKMWRNFPEALKLYHDIAIDVWKDRGFKNTMEQIYPSRIVWPTWLGNEDFHASHRAALLRKDPEWYSQFGWDEDLDLQYVWPT